MGYAANYLNINMAYILLESSVRLLATSKTRPGGYVIRCYWV